ncbi:ABC transporter substrate-binding protein [Hydrogenophaga pseudoflava]|uniref:ABC transporter substrate-binding protein n=1 Tax=Hydrogenophaga pseudoflava TaxID=47421 RepID=UPI000A03D71A|nr:ABC transporter substrate-binding protein [Hydrogenophaga pseudoflava]
MWSRREWLRSWASALPMVAGLPAAMAQGSAKLQSQPSRAPFGRVVLAVENRAAFCYLPLTIADRMGYFAAEGLDVQVRDLMEPGTALQALLSGSAQVLSGPYSTSVALRARGKSYPSIVLQGRAPQLVLGVSHKTLAGFRNIEDLRGRKVLVPSLGSGAHRMVLMLMAAGRLGAETVDFVPVASPTAALANFRNGLVDAICYTDPVITQLEQDSALRLVADTRTVRGNADVFGGPMPAGCLSVAADYLGTHRDECQALVHGLVHALKWLQTAGLSDINKVVPESYFQGDRALYLAAFSRAREAWSPDGLMPDAGPATMARVMSRFDTASPLRQVDLSQTFTNDMALKAKARFKA